jgi:hypothetical protein
MKPTRSYILDNSATVECQRLDLMSKIPDHWPDMNAYAAAKGALIAEITTRAEDWARTVDWRPAS